MELTAIVERIKKGLFWDFPGGVHPEDRKTLSNTTEIRRLPLSQKLYIPVKQHVGVSGTIDVEPGQTVLKGQALTTSSNPLSVPVHAPTSGEIISIKQHVSAHASGLPETTIVLKPDFEERWVDLVPPEDYHSLDRARLVEIICNAGISGMGGAGFPSHIKLSSSKDVDFLIINGVECEPYITSDDRLMREHAWQIRQGIDVLKHVLTPKNILIAIEDNKPEALAAMKIAFQDSQDMQLCLVPTKYPAGGEKQLVQVLTGLEIPSGKLPIDIGVLMYNVGTCFAVADAVFSGKPLIERVVTLTGKALDAPCNVWAPLGTPLQHLLEQAQYQRSRQKQKQIIIGGPMMGFTAHSELVPVVKITNCILVPASGEIPALGEESPCIRCGACADACPAGLLPQQLYWHSKGKEFEKAKDLNLFECIECGACAFVCPSEIPLVQYYRQAKSAIRIEQEEAEKADKARERFEARAARLEREKAARQAKADAAAAARQERQKASSGGKDKVAAALARAKAKKQEQTALDQAGQATAQTTTEASNANKSASVAAAIARAKAKKAARENGQQGAVVEPERAATETPAQDDKQDKVAAAIARAKAKKAARENGQQGAAVESEVAATETPAQDDKQDKVAAAIARAKAKKTARDAGQQEAAGDSDGAATETPAQDDKQDKVAAAIARAKAKKAAREAAQQDKE